MKNKKYILSMLISLFGAESVHIAEPDSVKAIPPKKLFIDIGAKSDQEAYALGIRPGLPALNTSIALSLKLKTIYYLTLCALF
jgi:putative aminopeptidase FrvX